MDPVKVVMTSLPGPAALPVKTGAGGLVLGALSESSGWVIVDAVAGAGLGWFIAPKGEELGYAIGGAAATGLGGVLGVLGLLGWRYLLVPAMRTEGSPGFAKENPAKLSARDYVAVGSGGRVVAGPFKHYDHAKKEADRAGGYVRYAAESSRGTRWTDWEILDSIDKGQMITPQAERRAVKLAQLGFIDTTGTWRLTAKGRRVVDQRVDVAAEARRKRIKRAA